jgi:aerotaxis receptor
MMKKITPIDEEFEIEEEGVLISQTDVDGVITYVNKKFRNVSGYSFEELVGQQHNIVRHPKMPKAIFKKMWETIQSGQVYNGVIKNLRKDGSYYWVEIEILPIKTEEKEVIGYISASRAASKKDIEDSEELYNKMLEDER